MGADIGTVFWEKLFHKLHQETFSFYRVISFLAAELRKINLDKSSCRRMFTCNISNRGEKWREKGGCWSASTQRNVRQLFK